MHKQAGSVVKGIGISGWKLKISVIFSIINHKKWTKINSNRFLPQFVRFVVTCSGHGSNLLWWSFPCLIYFYITFYNWFFVLYSKLRYTCFGGKSSLFLRKWVGNGTREKNRHPMNIEIDRIDGYREGIVVREELSDLTWKDLVEKKILVKCRENWVHPG